MQCTFLLGGIDSVYIKNLIIDVFVAKGHKVVYIADYDTYVSNEGKHFLEDYKIPMEYMLSEEETKKRTNKALKWTSNIIKIRKKAKLLEEKYHPDTVNVQYVSPTRLIFANAVSKKANKCVSFWGSDLLCNNRLYLATLYKYGLQKADTITCDALSMKKRLHDLYKGKFDAKTEILRYANHCVEHIDDLRKTYTSTELKQQIGLPNDGRYIVALGYNGSPRHHHIELTRVIARLPEELQKKLFVVYPMTYAIAEKEYMEQVYAVRAELKCESVILTSFMNMQEMARLHLVVDCFIHAQDTDAYSQTFVNYLYADTMVIQGRWLHYGEINKYNYNLVEFNDYEELTDILIERISGDKLYNNVSKQVKDTILQTESPQYTTDKWEKCLIMQGEKL